MEIDLISVERLFDILIDPSASLLRRCVAGFILFFQYFIHILFVLLRVLMVYYGHLIDYIQKIETESVEDKSASAGQ